MRCPSWDSRWVGSALLTLGLIVGASGQDGVIPAPNMPFETIPSQSPKQSEPKQVAPEKAEPKKETPKKSDEPYVVGSDLKMTAVWRDGVFFETAHRDFYFHAGGIFQYDASFFQANDDVMFGTRGTGPLNDGANLRRARLRFDAGFWENYEVGVELELANGTASGNPATASNTFNAVGPTDAWLQINQLPVVGHLRFGNQKEWFSLEHLNNGRFLELMERSLIFDAFVPTPFNNGFSPGISAFNTHFDDRLFWGVGIYKNNRNVFGFGSADGELAVTGRITGLPIYENEGQRLLHLGAGASYRDPVDGLQQFRVRPVIQNAPVPLLPLLADTGLVSGDSQQLFNVEAAAVLGPLTIQAEYTASFMKNASQGSIRDINTLFYQGWYVQATYFLTGESRPYDKAHGAFTRIVPIEPFHWVDGVFCGKGAWELAARFTALDLSNQGIDGGVIHSVTLGVNWYLTSNSRFQFNYDLADRTATGGNSSGVIHALGARVQFDF